jgi:RNA recognition motif-containing protein
MEEKKNIETRKAKENEDTEEKVEETAIDTNDKKRKKKSKKKRKKNIRQEEQKEKGGKNDDKTPEANTPSPTKRRKLNEPTSDEISKNKSGIDEKSRSGNDEQSESDDDDDDDDDGELLAAAALWAGNPGGEEEEGNTILVAQQKGSTPSNTHSQLDNNQNLSLHITQLPFDSAEIDLRKLFAEHGCSVTSIRMVYDKDTRGYKTVFRGVAFVDVLDTKSYETALKLNHKTTIRGRKLNIRPTRSKQELADIVSRTKVLVEEKIREQRASGETAGSTAISTSTGTDKKNKKDKDKKSKNKKKDTNKAELRNDADGNPIKLSKKERNRRAAIIMNSKGRRKGKK